MSSRTSNWIIAAGAVVVFGGVCILLAAVSDHAEGNLLGVGAIFFSLGILMIAAAVYIKGRLLQVQGGSTKDAPNSGRRIRGGCDLCGTETPVVHCKVHQLHLCGNCLAEHYDFRSCAYAPSTRRTKDKGSKSVAAKRGA